MKATYQQSEQDTRNTTARRTNRPAWLKPVRRAFFSVLALTLLAVGSQRALACSSSTTAAVPSYQFGGVAVRIPSPSLEFIPLADKGHQTMESFIAKESRLIVAFTLTNEVASVAQGPSRMSLSRYALVQVIRAGEYNDVTASDFKEASAITFRGLGMELPTTLREAEEEWAQRLQELDVTEIQVDPATMVPLGCLFRKPNAHGFGVVVSVSRDGVLTRMGVGCALIRVNQRLITASVYAEVDGKDAVAWIRKMTQDWADAIVRANATARESTPE